MIATYLEIEKFFLPQRPILPHLPLRFDQIPVNSLRNLTEIPNDIEATSNNNKNKNQLYKYGV